MNKELSANTNLSHYRIVSKIGAGGMGEVYLAEDTKLDRKVAIKFLNEEFSRDSDKLNRFIQEAKAASALNHPNILTVYEIGETDETNYIVTEFIEGKTLREHISSKELLSLNAVLKVGVQVSEALSAAHQAGIIHRDIKPENVMIRRDGYAKVLDFGLAKLTEKKKTDEVSLEGATKAFVKTNPGMVMGTVSYMSPEQARGKEIDARTDVWSLGVVLYEMLSGKVPFTGETVNHIIVSILEKEPLLLANAPNELQRIVRKTLTKDVEMRYQTAHDLLIDLKNLRRDLDIQGELERSAIPNRKETAESVKENETQIYNQAAIEKTQADKKILPTENVTTASSLEYAVTQAKSHKLVSAIIAVVLLGAISAIAYFAFFTKSNTKQIESIAVMPFVNESGNADVEYLSDGMTETLISSLSNIPKLNVKARSSVFRYKGKELDFQKIAQELKVQAILFGRVIQRGDQITLNLELVDAQTENILWAEQYNRKQTDLVSLQSEIALDVSQKLKIKLSGVEQQKLTKNYTANTEAYQLYLKGLFYWNKFPTKEYEKSRDYFEQAIDVDPIYALAFSGLADYYGFRANSGLVPPDEYWLKAEAAANKALALDASLGEAHSSLAAVKMYYYRDWAGAERELKQAIELSPNNSETHQLYGGYLIIHGRFDEGLAEHKKALELEPLSLRLNRNLARAFYRIRDYDRAIEQYQKTLELVPNNAFTHRLLGDAYQEKGMQKEAVAEWSKALRLTGDTGAVTTLTDDQESAMLLERTFAASGFNAAVRALWQRELEKLNEKTRREEYFSAMEYVIAYTRLADKEQAFAWLAKAEQERNWLIFQAIRDPRYDSLHSDSRFQDLLRRVGLPQ
ncbi:MAG: FlgO family outer membrane protein [Pyrinomonadaceae bacterium]